MSKTSDQIIAAAAKLRDAVNQLTFSEPTAYVYNPLDYAWSAHERYLKLYATSKKRVVMLGMNPGPFGMAQTGVPFGEINAVTDFLNINASNATIGKPPVEHPKRIVDGFACDKSEVSGRRLWGLFAEKYQTPKAFFKDHFITNYCPLVFMEASSRNRTPDKLPVAESAQLFEICDTFLRELVNCLKPEFVIGVGAFAEKRAMETLGEDSGIKFGRILHPSPASPLANKDWPGMATKQLQEIGVW
jgi:single-strand selective monofunctional uracil DNA glycosylase